MLGEQVGEEKGKIGVLLNLFSESDRHHQRH
jgi:hypothetical protein